jgi:hypothetical protein
MIVCNVYEGDRNELLKDVQYEFYGRNVTAIFTGK